MNTLKIRLPHVIVAYLWLMSIGYTQAQDVERFSPPEWEGLIEGGRFIDRFLPLGEQGELRSDTWGQAKVKPRYTDNGLEDSTWSYWGGNIVVDENNRYNLFVCRWAENNPKGHKAWPKSEVVHAIADQADGPYQVIDKVGRGHNPEIQQLKDGRYMIYVNQFSGDLYYLSESLNGPWDVFPFTYDTRQRQIVDHIANNTFVKREDGSMLMVSRGGGVWISQTGLPPYHQLSQETVYPPYEGRYEDPVIWKTDIQYHLIVNDWLGRIAYYMRSKDGIHWKLDAGEAYLPGIAYHHDGRVEDWYKFERIKVLQDQYGRAYQANFAVADTLKNEDLGHDNHSSKNICIPLTTGRLIELVSQEKIDKDTKEIQLLIKAERGFDPHKDINIKSLRFGAPEEVDYGRGAKVLKTEKKGDDVLLTFRGKGNGISSANFVAKLLGRTRKGQLLYAYTRLPWVEYILPVLTCKYPEITLHGSKTTATIEIENFGQVASQAVEVSIDYLKNNTWKPYSTVKAPIIMPYQKVQLSLKGNKVAERNQPVQVRISIKDKDQVLEVLEGPIIVR